MAGAKTRFGFRGSSDPPDDEEPRSARTVFGHDIHLQLPPGSLPPRPPGSSTPLPSPPAARAPDTATGIVVPTSEVPNVASTERHPRPRRSRLARFLGRWSRSGRFEASSRMRLDGNGTADHDEIEIPRVTTGRNVLLVLLAALLAFGITFAVVKLRYRMARPALPPPAQATAPPAQLPTTSGAPVPSARLAPPAPSPAAATAATPGLGSPAPPAKTAPPSDPAARGLGVPTSPRRPTPRRRYRAEPPPHLKGELLPIR